MNRSDRANVYALAVRLAPHLSAWTVEGLPSDDCGVALRLVGTGAKLWLSCDWKGRVEIGGCFPMLDSGRVYSPPGREDYGRISFDPARDPSALARDIERRCLSVYLPAYERALSYVHDDANTRQRARIAAQRIAAEAKTDARKQGSDGSVDIFPETPGCYRIQVHPRDEGPQVHMQLESLTPDQAVAVLALLRYTTAAPKAEAGAA